ncbi:MAG: thioredoxin-disulfide reductase [Firmicutes bacterium]|nr:thioredoxin-disulfide reductase [Bacillota bacterium]
MYDVAIIGGGPGGLSAGIYAARANLKTVIIERGLYGGQMQNTLDIENYPGFDNIEGPELSEHMYNQAMKLGVEWKYGDVTSVKLEGQPKVLTFGEESLEAKSIIIASGATPRPLGVPGEAEFTGRGVSYCATCDGALYRGADVAVVGGGDSAIKEALLLTRYASTVTVIHRRDALRAAGILRDRALANPKIRFKWDSVVERVEGDARVGGVLIRNVKDNSNEVLAVKGVFIYIGVDPVTDFLEGSGILDEDGYIPTGHDMATSIPGVFAAGDVRATSIRQIISAASEGATAALHAYDYVESLPTV